MYLYVDTFDRLRRERKDFSLQKVTERRELETDPFF